MNYYYNDILSAYVRLYMPNLCDRLLFYHTRYEPTHPLIKLDFANH